MQKIFLSYGILALLLALFTAYVIILSFHEGPYRDMWIAMDFIRGWFSHEASIMDLFSLHGGAHRLAVPKALFLVDYGIFKGSNLFLMATAFLTQLGMVYLMWLWVREEPAMTMESRWFLVALCLLLMFNATQLENFLYTFDVQWFITVAAAAWALRCWVLKYVIAGCIWGLISLFSSFSGVCVWLLLPLLMLIQQRRWWWVVLAICVVLAMLIAYTRGPFGGTTEWIGIRDEITLFSVAHFFLALTTLWFKWIFLYLGSPLGREYPLFAAICVTTSFIFLGYQFVRLWRVGFEKFTSFQVWCLFIALFSIAVGFVTGWGRMHFINTADEDRYQSVVALYWLGVFSLGYLNAINSQISIRYLASSCIFFWTCLVIPYFAIKDAQAQINFFDHVNVANLAIVTGQWEFQSIKSTLILGDKAKRINRPELHGSFLRERGWGIFSTRQARQLGETLKEEMVDQEDCIGQILTVMAVGDGYRGYRLTGQAYDVENRRLLKKILIIDDKNTVVGLGRLQREKDSFLPVTWQPRHTAQWAGYTLDLPEGAIVEVLAERGKDSYCWLGKTATIPGSSF